MTFFAQHFAQPAKWGKWEWLVGAVVIVGIVLRGWQFAQFPIIGETKDEIAWTMLGASWLQTGVPQSWSFFEPYTQVREVELAGSSFRLVQPAVDHPPLFSFLPGLASTLQGATWDSYPSGVAIRAPQVLLASFNLLLLVAVARRWLGRTPGALVAILCFALVPSWVFVQRLVVSETLLLTWILCILLGLTAKKDPWLQRLTTLALWALPLTKITGLAVGVGVLAGSWRNYRKQWWRMWALGALAGVVTLLGYAALVDWSLFWQVQLAQGGRDTGLLTFFTTLVWNQTLVRDTFADPWLVLGLGTTLPLTVVKKAKVLDLRVDDETWLTFRSMLWAILGFWLVSVGEQTVHGWYRIVLFPFFALSFGVVANWIWRQRSLWGLALVWILLSLLLRQGLWYAFGPTLFAWQGLVSKVWLLGAGSLIAADLWLPPRFQERVFKVMAITLTIILICCSISTITLIRDTRFWEDRMYVETGVRS